MQIPFNKLAVAAGLCSFLAAAHAGTLTGPIQNPANGHFYYLLANDTWTDAQAQAVSLGGNLVTVNDQAENTWVASTFLNYGGVRRDLWLGGTDAGTEGHWRWANGEAFSYSNWEPGQPDNGGGYYPNENYLDMYGGTTTEHLPGWVPGAWNDLQDRAGYFSNTGTFREMCGVVEVVPEPAVGALLLVAGPLLLASRARLLHRPAPATPRSPQSWRRR